MRFWLLAIVAQRNPLKFHEVGLFEYLLLILHENSNKMSLYMVNELNVKWEAELFREDSED